MRVIGPISAQPPGQLYGQTVLVAAVTPDRTETERCSAPTLPSPIPGDAAQWTLLMAHAMGRASQPTPLRVIAAYRRAEQAEAPILSVFA